MVINSERTVEQDEHLWRCIDDLDRIFARFPISHDDSLPRLVPDLFEMLVDLLKLDLVYFYFKDPASSEPFEVAWTAQSLQESAQSRQVGDLSKSALGLEPRQWPSQPRFAIGDSEVAAIVLPLGIENDSGVLVAGSRRAEFPDRTERLRLRIVATQIASWLHERQLLNERKRASGTGAQQVALQDEKISAISREQEQEIAELRRLVDSLRVREIDIQLVVDAIPAPIAIMTAEGEVQTVNRLVLEYFGKSVEELKRWSTIDAVHPDDLEPTVSAWRRAVETGEPYEIESRHRRSDGVYRWFHVRGFPLRDISGKIVCWCVLQIDIEDRKSAQNAQVASERNLNLIINTIPALVWSARPDGSAEFFNHHYLDYVGLSSEMVQDWGWTAAVHPDDLSGLANAWQVIMASRQPGEKEARLRRFDGTYRWFLFRANPLRDQDGNVVRWFGLNTDIEDRKKAEEDLRSTQAKLAHIARVMTVGELTASIAHEISQPLSGIVTNASTGLRMLTADPPNVAGARETVRRTIRDGSRVSDIIGRLRALFNRKAPLTQPIDLNEATREVIALSLDRLRRDRVSLRTELADSLPLVRGDRIQLQQVILNLVQNALDAMSMVDGRARALIIKTELDQSDRVRLSVIDSGPGLDPAVAERLFDPFFTTKEEGMGIGLSVSRSIIDNHHGHLWAAPNDGPGATFSFSIPWNLEDVTGVHDREARRTLAENRATRNS
ncbi:PAS domain-containing protein [Bradyrhizobium sp. STM 3557]|uniref:PAS domain-containing sensor histidine kinase n=1 Tax=Bradyrhizobium sp. STM 3557 TaxID=578920 RepID=UPI00389028E2